jgi:hypothetical protein
LVTVAVVEELVVILLAVVVVLEELVTFRVEMGGMVAYMLKLLHQEDLFMTNQEVQEVVVAQKAQAVVVEQVLSDQGEMELLEQTPIPLNRENHQVLRTAEEAEEDQLTQVVVLVERVVMH